jgi:hypothetical protein
MVQHCTMLPTLQKQKWEPFCVSCLSVHTPFLVWSSVHVSLRILSKSHWSLLYVTTIFSHSGFMFPTLNGVLIEKSLISAYSNLPLTIFSFIMNALYPVFPYFKVRKTIYVLETLLLCILFTSTLELIFYFLAWYRGLATIIQIKGYLITQDH